MKNTQEADILQKAVDRMKEIAGLAAMIKPGRKGEDARLAFKFPNRRGQTEFIAEIKPAAGNALAGQLAAMEGPRILVTNHINPEQAERFRKMGVRFIDCAGNAYIHTPDYFLFVKGNKPERTPAAQPARILKPGGLQVIFALLCNPDLAAAAYRDIAIRATVALGTVAWAMKDLQNQGYIIDPGDKKRRLVKRVALLRLWLAGYEQLLRPRLLIGRYRAEIHDWQHVVPAENALWGGEVAAYAMTGHLKPERATIFALRLPERMVLQYRLRRDPQGEFEVLMPFWNFDYPEEKEGFVPPLLIYADLMIRADGRTTETARMVYERYLARHFEEH
jgi:hypothetical protein